MTHTRKLVRGIVRDLISDARCALRDSSNAPEPAQQRALLAYAEKCRRQVGTVFQNRHAVKLDRYGWPTGILNESHK